jgi:hypothetical protein
MADASQNFVVQPEELRKLNSDFELAWTIVRSSVDGPFENENEVKFRLAKILIGLTAERTEQQDLAVKAAAQCLDSR